MIIRNATEGAIRAAARSAGVALRLEPSGRGFRVVLSPDTAKHGDRYRRTGFSRTTRGNRRFINATCYHGFLHFMRVLYARAPGAVVRSSMATFRDGGDFLRQAPDIAARNIGSMVDPLPYGSACRCDERARARAAGEVAA